MLSSGRSSTTLNSSLWYGPSPYARTCDPSHIQVAYQRVLQLTYVEELLGALKTIFVKLFQPFLAAFVASLHVVKNTAIAISNPEPPRWNFAEAFEGWDAAFDKLLQSLENKVAEVRC